MKCAPRPDRANSSHFPPEVIERVVPSAKGHSVDQIFMHQTDTIIWIPITEKAPPSGFVLASTKIDVHILQYSESPAQVAQGEFWMDRFGNKSDIPFEDVIAWSELPRPFSPRFS